MREIFNEEAEQAVIASLISDSMVVDRIIDLVSPDDFYLGIHKIIIDSIIKLHKGSTPIDLIPLNAELTSYSLYEKYGVNYLNTLVENIPTTANAEYYLRVVKEKSEKRRISKLLEESLSDLSNNGFTSIEVIESLENNLNTVKTSSIDSLSKEIDDSTEHKADDLLEDHIKLTKSDKIKSGFSKIDSSIYFTPTDFNIIQSMSNHGKTSLMLNLAFKFLLENEKVDCVFVTYETSKLKIREKLLNTMSLSLEQKKLIQFDKGEYTYGECENTKSLYNRWHKEKRLAVLSNVELNKIKTLVRLTKKKDRVLIIFLDYIQIIDNDLKVDGWQKIKEIAYTLEKTAVKEEIIIFVGSQVNEKRETREGKDIYNSATNVIDLFNHSHDKLLNNKDLSKEYKEKRDNKSVISITIDKSKYFQTNKFEDCFLFDGFVFEENKAKYEV